MVGGFGKRTGIGFSRRVFLLLVKVTGEGFLGFIGVGVGPASRVACGPSAEPKNALQSVFDRSAGENESKAGLEKSNAGSDARVGGLKPCAFINNNAVE